MPTYLQKTKCSGGATLDGITDGDFIWQNWHPATVSSPTPYGTYIGNGKWMYSYNDGGTTKIYGSTGDSDWVQYNTYPNFAVYASGHQLVNGYVVLAALNLSGDTVLEVSDDYGATFSEVPLVSGNYPGSSIFSHPFGVFVSVNNELRRSVLPTGAYSSVLPGITLVPQHNGMFGSPSLMVVLSRTSNAYWTSSNGTSWSARTLPNSLIGMGGSYGKLKNYLPNAYYIFGTDATGVGLYRSSSGTTGWTKIWTFASTVTAKAGSMTITSDGHLICWVGGLGGTSHNQGAYISSDGVNWKQVTGTPYIWTTDVETIQVIQGGTQIGILGKNYSKFSLKGG